MKNFNNEIGDLYTKDKRLNTAILRQPWFKESPLFKQIILATEFLDIFDPKFSERVYCFSNKILYAPICICCGEKRKVFSPFNGEFGSYQQTCNSRSCIAFHTSGKRIETCLQKYGTKVSTNTIEAAKRRTANLQIKGRETILLKYKVSHPSQISGHYEKCKKTLMENYGVEHNAQIPKNIEQREIGVSNRWNSKCDSIKILNFVEPSDLKKSLFVNPNTIIKFQCNTCENIEELPSETFKWRVDNISTPCIKCSGVSMGSAAQSQVFDFLRTIFGGEILINDKSQICPLELDFFMPELKIAIEFDGIFWHSFNREESKAERDYHLLKTEKCEQLGIQLIHIFENEWILKQDIVKSRLRNLLKQNQNKIFARTCRVMNISPIIAKQFMDDNHIQGSCNAKIQLGLYSPLNDLVGVMSFGKSRFNRKFEYELIRFASKLDMTIVGGASKLLSHFKMEYSPNSIISYADRRWSQGNIYKTLGFSFSHNSSANFWIIEKGSLILQSRLKFQKHILEKTLTNFDPLLTADKNIFLNGYRRIWDCGNKVFIWNNE